MRLKRLVFFLLISFITLSLSHFLRHTPAVEKIENILYDLRVGFFLSERKAPAEVVLVLVDEASLESMDRVVGMWPWPRSVHGEVIDFLKESGAKTIVYDILFTGTTSRKEDEYLRDATLNAGNVVHAMHIFQDEEDSRNPRLLNRALPADLLEAHSLRVQSPIDGPHSNNYSIPYPGLYRSASALGFVGVEPDRDGVYRKAPLYLKYGEHALPSLSLAAFLREKGQHLIRLEEDRVVISLKDRSLRIPCRGGICRVKFYGKFRAYSMSAVLASLQAIKKGNLENLLIHPEELRGSVVFIGASAVGLQDLKPTPISPTTPGVIIHASLYSNLLKEDFLKDAPAWTEHLSAFLIAFLIITLINSPLRIGWKILFPLVLLAVFFSVSFLLFYKDLVINMAYPGLSGLLALFGGLSVALTKEEREKQRIRKRLEKYVSSATLTQILKDRESALLGEKGTEVELSILFCDLVDFTTISERLDPEKTVRLLNTYFEDVAELILKKEGTIDKYIGDAILAYWGAPIRRENHPCLAVETAIHIVDALTSVNQKLRDLRLPAVKVGIGINTSRVVLGNVGSRGRMDYTIIGDGVNLASRLQSLTRFYGVDIILSQNTAEMLETNLLLRTLDIVRVKGKTRPVKIYEALKPSEENYRKVELTESAFNAYMKKEWHRAIELYERVGDKVSQIFIERCLSFIKSGVPEDWDGVCSFSDK